MSIDVASRVAEWLRRELGLPLEYGLREYKPRKDGGAFVKLHDRTRCQHCCPGGEVIRIVSRKGIEKALEEVREDWQPPMIVLKTRAEGVNHND